MPWFAPSDMGRRTRARMGIGYWFVALVLSLAFPLLLLFGVGNFIVMRIAPEAVWPPEVDQESRR